MYCEKFLKNIVRKLTNYKLYTNNFDNLLTYTCKLINYFAFKDENLLKITKDND